MGKADSKAYALYPGCLIQSKFPYIEKASRVTLEALGVELHDLDGTTCCPNQMTIQTSDKSLWEAIAARNLALAEKEGYDILTLCNGCYDTLKTVNSRLRSNDKLRAQVNESLATQGLKYQDGVEVKHIVQVLVDDVGMAAIEKRVRYHLKKLKCAPFEGCHVKRPMDHMGFDDPHRPMYLSEVIRAMGGEIVNYPERNSCCGGGLSVGRKDDVIPAARRVIRSVLESGGEALIVNCPFCFAQFYRNEREINEIYLDGIHLPIFYITELLALAMGFDPGSLGMDMHFKNGVGEEHKTAQRIQGVRGGEQVFDPEVTREQLEICSKCLACADDCQTAMTTTEYHPEEILRLVLQGRVDEALERPDIWYCMNCHECAQRCPQGFGMVKLMLRLKNLAIEKGICPEVVKHRMSDLTETGFSFPRDEESREGLGLPEVNGADAKELKDFMNQVRRKQKEQGG
jgi:heterodisulfide reductase subunit B